VVPDSAIARIGKKLGKRAIKTISILGFGAGQLGCGDREILQRVAFRHNPDSLRMRSVSDLPRVTADERGAGYNGHVGGRLEFTEIVPGRCLYHFVVDSQTGRMIGWYFEFAEDECDCLTNEEGRRKCPAP
jgi:hypothetical protein